MATVAIDSTLARWPSENVQRALEAIDRGLVKQDHLGQCWEGWRPFAYICDDLIKTGLAAVGDPISRTALYQSRQVALTGAGRASLLRLHDPE